VRRAALVAVVLLVAVAAALPGCGGGPGGGGDGGAAGLTLVTTQFPILQRSSPVTLAIVASGGTPPYSFRVLPPSTLPAGFSLSSTGVLTGSSNVDSSTLVIVEASDAAAPPTLVTRQYLVQVGGFDVAFDPPLFAGDAWTGASYAVSASTAYGPVRFEIVSSGSAAISGATPALGTATYVASPGPTTDRIRATRQNGVYTEVSAVVRTSPVSQMTARFGTTDVWHVAFEGKRDAGHPYASDFHDALARVGLRDPFSVDALGTTADRLAEAYVRVETLRQLNAFFLNDPSGAALPSGLAASFPWDEPDGTFLPPPGGVMGGYPGAWNRITVHAGNTPSFWGYSVQDDGNQYVENLTTSALGSPLGLFVDTIVPYFNVDVSNTTLPAAPVGAGDVEDLRTVLYGGAPPHARAQEIRRIVVLFAGDLAYGCAHEIGHALGLYHVVQAGAVMDSWSMFLPPGTPIAFTAADLVVLRAALPGPGR
jgi:hypothetical protein